MLRVFEDAGIKGSEFDCLTFLPSEDDNVRIEAGRFEKQGEKLGGSKLGDSYEVILFKDGDDGPTHIDHFKTILVCPLEYASHLIPAGWYGMIMKWTTTSSEVSEDLLEKIKSYA